MEASTASSATSSSHDLSSSAASSPEEFYVTVELYLSKTAVAARKVRLPNPVSLYACSHADDLTLTSIHAVMLAVPDPTKEDGETRVGACVDQLRRSESEEDQRSVSLPIRVSLHPFLGSR